jgi:hypothetical protein
MTLIIKGSQAKFIFEVNKYVSQINTFLCCFYNYENYYVVLIISYSPIKVPAPLDLNNHPKVIPRFKRNDENGRSAGP